MFQNPTLQKLESILREASAPEHGIFGDDSRTRLYELFHQTVIKELNLTNASNKKITEANQVILFALAYPHFPDAAITPKENPGSKREYPDFILETSDRKIGLEVREVYVAQDMKQQEYLKEEIVKRAHEIYKGAGHPPVMADIAFDNRTNYRKSCIEKYAQRLVMCVPPSLASRAEWTTLNKYDDGIDFPAGLSFIQGRAPRPYEPQDGRWEANRSGSVYSGEKFFEEAIKHKEGKLDGYKNSRCDEYWLLLVVPGFSASSFMDRTDPTPRYRSRFQRVFAFWLAQREVSELHVV